MEVARKKGAPVAAITAYIASYPAWWKGLSWLRKYVPGLFVVFYLLALWGLGGLRQDHVNICAGILALSYGGRLLDPLLNFLLPLIGTAVVYDSQRFYEDYIRGPIHVTQPYWFDKTFFGIKTAQGILTPNEWWQLHTVPALDLITGFMYLAFIGIFVIFAAWMVFFVARRGTGKVPARELMIRAPGVMWAFFCLNVLGYSTYYWYAAAPPWYVALYGLGPARMDVHPSSAGCIRFDQILGTHFFSEMYGRSCDVFGAIPSLHVAYPLLAVFFAFRFGTGRVFAICFYLLMCFSAVYLNHHYILDILWGSAYAILIGNLIDRYFSKGLKPARL